MTDAPLSGKLIIELGDRVGISACGSLLAQLGATVVFVEPIEARERNGTKWAQRPLFSAGKRSLVIDNKAPGDLDLLTRLVGRCDVILVSSDVDDARFLSIVDQRREETVLCDVTAFGTSHGQVGGALTDAALQALTGLIDVTGSPDHAPVLTQVPILELSCGILAAAATVAALRARRTQGLGQRVESVMYDCGVTMLSTFLPKHFAGQTSNRVGNRHPSIAPWNCFRATDGWVQLCSGTDDLWSRFEKMLSKDGVIVDGRFASRAERVRLVDELDSIIARWASDMTVKEVIERFLEAGQPCGQVHKIQELLADENLNHRGMVLFARDPHSGRNLRMPGNLFSKSSWGLRGNASIPELNEGRCYLDEWLISGPPQHNSGDLKARLPARPVLAGVRVLEIGQWTTAPLAARLLGALGADVVKIEMPGGDPARGSPPVVDGESYLFNLNNSEKRCLTLDLRTAQGKSDFEQLLSRSDVLVENLKSGSLARLGFDFNKLSALNSGLVYCAISGFGADSAYPGRAAMDTVLQAVCGVMDLTKQDDIPYKTGVSLSDLIGGYFGVLAILCALETRSQVRQAQFIDLSMQDMTAWITQLSWNDVGDTAPGRRIRKTTAGFALDSRNAVIELVHEPDITDKKKVQSVPVRSVAEVATALQTIERKLIRESHPKKGRTWPLLVAPFNLEKTPAAVERAPTRIDDVGIIIREWNDGASRQEGRAINAAH